MVRLRPTGFNGDGPALAAGRVRLQPCFGRFPRLYLFFEPLRPRARTVTFHRPLAARVGQVSLSKFPSGFPGGSLFVGSIVRACSLPSSFNFPSPIISATACCLSDHLVLEFAHGSTPGS